MQTLKIFQSLWAMEIGSVRRPDRDLNENIKLIAEAGFDGISAHWYDRTYVKQLDKLMKDHGLEAEGQCFPKTVDDLKPALDTAVEFGVHHLCLQPDVRPRSLDDCLPLLEGWQQLSEEAGVEVLIETHRGRMTNDLFFTLDLIERMPSLKLLGDLSHFVVGREFTWPVSDENHALMHRILDSSCAFHGRVASSEQVQVELSFPHHKQWLDLFLDWWGYGFRSWRRREAADASLAFVCELGPRPYSITDRYGEDTTDRWVEALFLKERIRALWAQSANSEF